MSSKAATSQGGFQCGLNDECSRWTLPCATRSRQTIPPMPGGIIDFVRFYEVDAYSAGLPPRKVPPRAPAPHNGSQCFVATCSWIVASLASAGCKGWEQRLDSVWGYTRLQRGTRCRILRTRSSAALKCIYDVPGFMKQVSAPLAISVCSSRSRR
jgi:hypothetical protein